MAKVAVKVDAKMPRQMGVDEELFGYVPMTPVMVSCVSADGRPNIIPLISWSFVNRWPPKITIGICEVSWTPSYFVRASHRMILETGEFVVNFMVASLWDQMVVAGSLSASDPSVDKFAAAGLTPGASLIVKAPTIEECPISVECVVTEHISLGSHHLYAGEVVAYHQYGEVVRQESVGDRTVVEYAPTEGRPGKRLVWHSLPRLEDVGG
jgi:flavin reductase (DIM6/NTAB) family NADH-FMN oxidoreductase RutF